MPRPVCQQDDSRLGGCLDRPSPRTSPERSGAMVCLPTRVRRPAPESFAPHESDQSAANVAILAHLSQRRNNSLMNGIRTNAAAVMLGISPNTLRSWERRYGFPKPQRSAGGHRQYSLTEIEALRLTLAETHNVSSAISLARERGEGPSTPSRLTATFTSFDEDGANRLLEESLGLRSVERTIEEVLLDAAHHAVRAGHQQRRVRVRVAPRRRLAVGAASSRPAGQSPRRRHDLRRLLPVRPGRHPRPGARGDPAPRRACARWRSRRRSSSPGWAEPCGRSTRRR